MDHVIGGRIVSPMTGQENMPRRLGAMAVAGTVLALTTMVPAHAEPLFTFTDPAITESSGLAWDPEQQLYWTVNDSGDTGRLFAVGTDGNTLGTYEFGAPVQDIEALARDESGRLYVGDIGDNDRVRDMITVYYFENPQPGAGDGSFRAWDFQYPDGPHDAEAMFLGPGGQLHIVTKEDPGGIYRAPAEPTADGVNELERVGDASPFITDAVTLPDGNIAVRTYTTVEVMAADLLAPVTRGDLPFQPQGETLALHPSDPGQVVVGSEGANQPLEQVTLPQGLDPQVPADASPPPEPTPEPRPEDIALEGPARSNRSGTTIAVVLAAVVSLAAGAFVWFRTRSRPAEEEPEPESEDTSVLGRRDLDRGYPITDDDNGEALMPQPRRALPEPPDDDDEEDPDTEKTIARARDWWF